MIQEQYVSFETAKLLKEKGFDIPVNTYRDDFIQHGKVVISRQECLSEDFYPAPTQALAMRWLREEKHIYIQIMLDSWACGGHLGYYIVIQKTDSDFEMMLQDAVDEVFYSTYEEAAEAAIKYCLEKLV